MATPHQGKKPAPHKTNTTPAANTKAAGVAVSTTETCAQLQEVDHGCT